jgi:hypothetical protein
LKGHVAHGAVTEPRTARHERGVRFFIDVVMAFATHGPMENVNFDEFHIDPERSLNDPDASSPAVRSTQRSAAGSGATDCAPRRSIR